MYQETESDKRIDAIALRQLVTDTFLRCNMRADDATLLSDSLVEADLRGVHSHGVLRVPEYVRKLTIGGVNPLGSPFIAKDSGACLVIDGDNSMGQIGMHFATIHAIDRARTTGIAAAAVRGSNHCGAMAYFAMQALPHDMIGIATTNAAPVMAAWGGANRLLGINPIGIAIPANEERPIVYDAAFAATAHGKVRVYQQKGLRLPEGWATDNDGNPTTDPAAAITGLLLPIGGFKGTGLAMIMGILSSILSGAAYGTELLAPQGGVRPGVDGHFVAVIRVDAFEDVEVFKQRVDEVIRQIHASKLAPGFERVYAPGEVEFETKARYQSSGVPLNLITREEIVTSVAGLGLGDAARTILM
jgi:LDH2 family malate/lactate/ureidoglycolate dehydrogenase